MSYKDKTGLIEMKQKVNTELISIVVPVYNVEKYISRCIESIIKQTYTNIEIIIIDDGSPDNSGVICDDFAKKDDRIRVIHQNNMGLSGARNTGIRLAMGSYIAFVDSDDWINTEMIEVLYNLIKEYDAQIAACGVEMIGDEGHVAFFSDNLDEIRVYSKDEAMNELLDDKRIRNVTYNKLYKTELFEDIEFPVGRIFEDIFTTYKLIDKSNIVVYTGKPLYYYYRSNGSILRSSFNVKRFDKVYACKERASYYFENYPNLFPKASNVYVESALVSLANSSNGNKEVLSARKAIRNTLLQWIDRYSLSLPTKEKISCNLLRLGLPTYDMSVGTACRIIGKVKKNDKRMG